MKLLRYGLHGQEKPGVLDGTGRIRDLSGVIADLTPETVTVETLARLKELDVSFAVAKLRQVSKIGLRYTLKCAI